jgi:hypothetical protein
MDTDAIKALFVLVQLEGSVLDVHVERENAHMPVMNQGKDLLCSSTGKSGKVFGLRILFCCARKLEDCRKGAHGTSLCINKQQSKEFITIQNCSSSFLLFFASLL